MEERKSQLGSSSDLLLYAEVWSPGTFCLNLRSCRQKTSKRGTYDSLKRVPLNLFAIRLADIQQENHGSYLVGFNWNLLSFFSSITSHGLASSVCNSPHSVISQGLVTLCLLHLWYPSSSLYSMYKYPGSADSSCLQLLAFHTWAPCCS